MKIYRLNFDYNKIMTVDSPGFEGHPISGDFNGELKSSFWSPFKVKTVNKKTCHDFIRYRPGVPVISDRTKRTIEHLVSNEVEFLPLTHDDLILYIMNVTNILECVDWVRSDIDKFSDGKFAGFNKLIFDFNKIPKNTYIFKIREAVTSIFITDIFKEIVVEKRMKGLDFSEVYDSEYIEEKEQQLMFNYDLAIAEIEREKGPEFSYEEALDKTHEGLAVASGMWKMQRDDQDRLWLGQLNLELSYQWLMPVYIPPILLTYSWHVVERSKFNINQSEQ